VEAAWRRIRSDGKNAPANATLSVERKREPSSVTGEKKTPGDRGFGEEMEREKGFEVCLTVKAN